MDLLFVVSGKISEIIKANDLDNNIKIKKIDEKDLSKFDFITTMIKEERVENLLFSVYSLDYLRFSFFMKYFLFKNNLNGAIIDQFGRRLSFNKTSFLLKDLPLFIFEILFSIFVVIYYQAIFSFKSEKI
jgi:hypothetical protein